ncbi:MAG: cytochrome P450 [Deltaproteobacteria bacterium]|nr:cytochrome P450 [Deltaproteobacteria bacterium]MBW2394085.1 cytochrome P450 [Deltaproteobacteria bacterium]
MTAANPSIPAGLPSARPAAPATRLRPGGLDLSDPKTFLAGVPHEYFRVLREQDPVHWQDECVLPVFLPGPGYWALTRYEDVAFVSKHPEIFSSALGTSSLNELRPRERAMAGDQLIQMDPPGHTELRSLMNVQFKPAAVREAEAHMRKIVCETLDLLEGRSECDFVDAVSAPISLRVLTNFLGVPDQYTARFYRWTNTTMRFGEPGVFNLIRARFALLQIFLQSTLLERERRKRPLPDVFSRLVNGEFQGKPLSRLMIQVNFFLLIIAGNETTRNALSGGIQALCENPDQFERLRRDPSLLPQAIEEMLRWVSPVMQFRRTATQATTIGDREIRKGDKVVVYYGAANRDPEVFENPEVFDITRKPNPHLAFGVGAHFCMGSHIARLEMRVTLEEFLRRYPRPSLAGAPVRQESNFISGIKRLPLNLA